MKVSFSFRYCNHNTWNGVYTGNNSGNWAIRTYRTKEDKARIKELLNGQESQTYHYNFEDGWASDVVMQIVDTKEANRRLKHTNGFSKPWMIDEILKYGRILKRKERHELQQQIKEQKRPIPCN